MEVKLEVIGRDVIKPSSPAPHDDRLQLSLLDLSLPAIYVATTFFYKSIAGESPEIMSRRLKTSLSETLSRFYPLAGRQEGLSICCNDEGVIFTEARTDLLLSDFLRNLSTNSLAAFLPEIEQGESAGTRPLLRVKVIYFGSGSGVAVTVGISHQICDASSLLTFAQAWAATSKGTTTCSPHFAGATIYPPPPPPASFQSLSIDDLYELRGRCVTNRLVFKSSKIAELKRKASSESVPVPTRVEAIMSLIWRCAANASRSNSASPKSTVMTQAMDLRLRIPFNVLPQDSMGNLQTLFFVRKGTESELEIDEMVSDFRKTKEEFSEMIKENLQGYDNDTATITTTKLGQNLLSVMGDFMSECYKPDIDLYIMSSWCRKPFYEVDFGWGNPVWMGPSSHTVYDNMVFVVLTDSRDGQDVEAWVGLPEQDMPVFLCDQDLLAYAVLNPPVLI
ncbi:BAHD acyltransferase [Raphanus sativus]|uniref:BAHD acyltransferase BIA1-like n=1 Tax=Raphanus sativus TaxID=3726 RepID=A0A6J0KIT3_RAPSA|nr:BAHD acyltransferase BIA1-like [Raphanus sativus]KAJ4912318.1 BAHD acyltransferase [Raphanus sativus]